jgi:hypothetical protein
MQEIVHILLARRRMPKTINDAGKLGEKINCAIHRPSHNS